jgi:hypothetical protein
MTDVSLIPAGRGRIVVQGVDLPTPPPARIYISGNLYRIAAPQITLPPINNVVKAVLNWVGPGAALAKNILHIGTPTMFITSNATALLDLANAIHTVVAAPPSVPGNIASSWKMNNVTVKDLSGSGAQATSTHAATTGGNVSDSLPPQTSIVLSWEVPITYRGGKPRTYLPGIPSSAISPAGSSAVSGSYAQNMETAALQFLNGIESMIVDAIEGFTAGLVSYYHDHAVRPTPVYNPFEGVRVHERLDSQRRRSGKESSFPTVG